MKTLAQLQDAATMPTPNISIADIEYMARKALLATPVHYPESPDLDIIRITRFPSAWHLQRFENYLQYHNVAYIVSHTTRIITIRVSQFD